MKNSPISKKHYAIEIKNISKSFRIPHEKIDTLRSSFVNFFKRKAYEEFKALDGISFRIKKGEFFGIVGRNGSGKSTLLKIMAGIYEPDKGRVKVNGEISPFLELGVGFNPELSGRDNIFLNASVLGMKQKEIEESFEKIVIFSELERFIDQKLKNYSSGMQVRLAFSVAIHANKDILLMDEVLAVGDNNFQQKCLEEFKKYRKRGKTVILVTHDMGVVSQYCDRALLLRKGKIEKIGKSSNIVYEYAYQNMSDEEKRLLAEENKQLKKIGKEPKKSLQQRIKDIVKITDVKFLDSSGNEKKEFQTGKSLTIRIFYKTKVRLEDPVFGISLTSSKGICVVSSNTKRYNYPIRSIDGNGWMDATLPELNLNLGLYTLNLGIFNQENTYSYDYQEKRYSFKVITRDDTQEGPFCLKVKWNLDKEK